LEKMEYSIKKEFPDDIIYENVYPCISLYMPTHRYSPDNKKDPILYKDLLGKITDTLKESYKKNNLESLLSPFRQIGADKDFWNNTLEGTAILCNPKRCVVYRLNTSVPEISIVSESFHIKPLIRFFQSMDRFHLLGLSQGDFAMWEGNKYGIEKIDLEPGTPVTIEEVLGEEHPQSYLSYGAYGKSDGNAMYHGHGGKKDAIKDDIVRFFRYVDRFVLDNYSRKQDLPLILVSLSEHYGMFKKISQNQNLVPLVIKDSYKALDEDKILDEALKIIEVLYKEKIEHIIESYKNAEAGLQGSGDLEQVAMAAVEGKVDTIMIEAEKMIPGRINDMTGKIVYGDEKDPEFDDVLDDLAESVMKKKGKVLVLPEDDMPVSTGAAAIYRYK